MRRLSILVCLLAIVSCTSKASIEGTWQEANGDRTLTFSDTAVTVTDKQHTTIAKYQFIDEQTMAWGMPHVISPFPVQYRLDGNTLVLILEDEEVVYQRQ